MATADFDSGGVSGDQRQADTQILVVAQQMVGVMGLERQAEQGGDGAKGDVALFPVQTQAKHFFALPLALADNPGVRHRASIRTCQWPGKCEAGDVIATGQAGQIVVALFVGAVMQQQFRRAQGVWHHYGRREVATAGGQFHGDLGVGVGREALSAVGFGDDQGEETVFLDVGPGLGREVHGLADLPVADHCAQFFGRAINECLFFFGQLGLGVGQQLVPVGAAAE